MKDLEKKPVKIILPDRPRKSSWFRRLWHRFLVKMGLRKRPRGIVGWKGEWKAGVLDSRAVIKLSPEKEDL
jgi:hypothetical protein